LDIPAGNPNGIAIIQPRYARRRYPGSAMPQSLAKVLVHTVFSTKTGAPSRTNWSSFSPVQSLQSLRLSLGAIEYLVKPFRNDQLLAAIRQASKATGRTVRTVLGDR